MTRTINDNTRTLDLSDHLVKPDLGSIQQRASGEYIFAYRKFGKRFLDLVLVLATLPLVFLVLVVLVLAIRSRGGPAFFAQDRLGRDGRIFRCWKLRTMVLNAEQVLEQYLHENPDARLEWETYQKLSNDPRITGVGRVLRKTSLDELPQLWNVLCGEMSLVGPRPMLPHQYALYPGKNYLLLRPGLTGSWQVSERNGCIFAARGNYDDAYYRELSLWTDIRILFATLQVVAQADGR